MWRCAIGREVVWTKNGVLSAATKGKEKKGTGGTYDQMMIQIKQRIISHRSKRQGQCEKVVETMEVLVGSKKV